MHTEASVFETTYRKYLADMGKIDLGPLADRLGARLDNGRLRLRMFLDTYEVSPGGILDPKGERPGFDVCVILSKYVLLCPDTTPDGGDWVSYRDFKDSGPLTTYFANEVERAIGMHFSGRPADLRAAAQALGGQAPDLDARYDLALRFDALPKIPLIMLYNDADEEFPATCSVLFESRADQLLDPECMAMLGWQLASRLRKADRTG